MKERIPKETAIKGKRPLEREGHVVVLFGFMAHWATANLKTIWPRGVISAKLQHKCKQLRHSHLSLYVGL